MKTIATKLANGMLAVALVGGMVSFTATPVDAGDKKTKTTTTGSGTPSGGKGTKGVSSMDLGSGR